MKTIDKCLCILTFATFASAAATKLACDKSEHDSREMQKAQTEQQIKLRELARVYDEAKANYQKGLINVPVFNRISDSLECEIFNTEHELDPLPMKREKKYQ